MKIRTSLMLCALVFALASVAQADLLTGPGGIVCPTGTNPITLADWKVGDTYHLAFATDTSRTTTSTDIAVYNAYVNAEADESALTGVPDVTWYAVGSTVLVAANDNAVVSAPVYLLDGTTMVASGYTDLWDGTIGNALNRTQENVLHATGGDNDQAWTGTTSLGVAYLNYELRSIYGDTYARLGSWALTDGTWLANGTNNFQLEWAFPMYAISEELTIVPEPATLALLGLGSLIMLARKRR